MTTSTAAIQIDGVSKSFGTVHALKGVSFDVPAGSVFGLLGKNGAGKTTLFSVIAQFLRSDAGEIRVQGEQVRSISQLRGRVTILPQDAQFQRNVPILEQLAFFRRLDGSSAKVAEQEVRTGLERVGLAHVADRSAQTLSHGMHKRLGIAQAFLGEPEVILLDEPTAGLDPANARQIRDLVQKFQSVKSTVVVSSHNLAEIQELCDHVAILDKGELRHCGSVEALTRSDQRIETVLSCPLEPPQRERLLALDSVTFIEPLAMQVAGYEIGLRLGEGEASWEEAAAGILRCLLDLGAVPRRWSEGTSLERFFLDLTADNAEDPQPDSD